MFNRKHLMAGLVAGLALAGGAAALAQPTPRPEAGPQPDRRQAMMQRMCSEMPARAAGRLAYTEVRIGITEQQKSAWQTFSQDVKAAMAPVQKLCTERAAMPRPTTPPDAATQLGEREKMLTAMLETTKGLRLAVEKLTPSLTDDQKKQVAEIVGRMGRGPGDRGMRGDRMMHRHDHGPGFGPGRGPMSPTNTPPSGPPR